MSPTTRKLIAALDCASVVSHATILWRVWPATAERRSRRDLHDAVRRARKQGASIVNVHGYGYRLNE